MEYVSSKMENGARFPCLDSMALQFAHRCCWLIAKQSLWVGTSNGLYRIHDGVADHYGAADGLSGDTVAALYEDREGNLWVVTDGGIDMFRDTPVLTYTTRQGLISSSIRAIAATRDGAVWIGNEGGANVLRGGINRHLSPGHGLPGRDVLSFCEDHSGVLWLGIDNKLLAYESGRFQEIKIAERTSHWLTVHDFCDQRGRERNIWAIGDQGLFRIRDRRVRESIELSR